MIVIKKLDIIKRQLLINPLLPKEMQKKQSKKFGQPYKSRDEVIANQIKLDRYKAQEVEDYQPLFKKLLKEHPLEKRY